MATTETVCRSIPLGPQLIVLDGSLAPVKYPLRRVRRYSDQPRLWALYAFVADTVLHRFSGRHFHRSPTAKTPYGVAARTRTAWRRNDLDIRFGTAFFRYLEHGFLQHRCCHAKIGSPAVYANGSRDPGGTNKPCCSTACREEQKARTAISLHGF